jgi:four helix bundle protein
MGALDVKSFRELTVWREAIELVVDSYRFADTLPPAERFGLVAQVKRCATSIPANIAEGHSRKHPKVFLNHVYIVLGSEAELATHIHVAERLGFCVNDQTIAISRRREHVGRMLNRLAAALKRKVESEARRAKSPEPLTPGPRSLEPPRGRQL